MAPRALAGALSLLARRHGARQGRRAGEEARHARRPWRGVSLTRSVFSALSDVEPLDDDFSSFSGDRLLELDSAFSSGLDLDDFFSLSSFLALAPAVHMPHEEPSRLIFGRSFLLDFGWGGGLGGAEGTAGGGTGIASSRDLDDFGLLFLLAFLSAMSSRFSSSSSAGKLTSTADFLLFFSGVSSAARMSSPLEGIALVLIELLFLTAGAMGAVGGGGGMRSVAGSSSCTYSKVLTRSAILPPETFLVFIEDKAAALGPDGVSFHASVSELVASRSLYDSAAAISAAPALGALRRGPRR